MRLTVKLGLATALSITTVAGFFAVDRVNRELAMLEEDTRRDHRTFGRALALAAQVVAQRHGFDEAKKVVAATNAMEAGILIEFVEGSHPRIRQPAVSPLTLLASHKLPDQVSIIPANLGALGYLRLQESRDAQARYVIETIQRALRSTLLLIALSLAITFYLGWQLLGHPLQKLVEKVRRVGGGDLDGPLSLLPNDEMSVLAREINAMCDRLREAQRRASTELEARMRALEQLRHADRLSTVGKLSSGVAHELGTPLNVISARAKMIIAGESRGAEVVDDSRVIFGQSERMARTIRQLLDFARSGSLRRSPQDLRALCRSSAAVLETLATRAGVDIVVQGGPSAVASVDPEQIQQVITNIVMNAIQAHPNGCGGTVRVQLTTQGSAGDAAASGARVFLEVSDGGVGISPDVLEHVFEPFFTTKDVGQGTGLGLSVAHGIVQEHGGVITIESAPDTGTIVRVELPVGESDE
jgi:two-component system NtrC family sensor kinase